MLPSVAPLLIAVRPPSKLRGNLKDIVQERYFLLLTTLVVVTWGTQHPALKVLSESLGPLTLNLWRFLITALCLAPLVRAKNIHIPGSDRLRLMMLGVVGIGIFGVITTLGIAHSTSSNSAVLVNTHPILTTFLAPLLISETSPKHLKTLMSVGFIGILIVLTDGFHNLDIANDSYLLGNCMLFAGALLLSIYTIFLKSYAQRLGALTATYYAICGGVSFLLIASLVTGSLSSFFTLTSKEFALLLYVAIVTTALGWVVWFNAVAKLGAAQGTSFIFLIPVFGVFFSVILLGESLSPAFLIGASLTIFSVLVINWRGRPSNQMHARMSLPRIR